MEDGEERLHKPPKRVALNINNKDEFTKGTSLPLEILIDILIRLPVKDLCKFRSVSKEWLLLISSDPLFLNMHTRLSNSTPLYTTCNCIRDSENGNSVSMVQITDLDLNNGTLCDQFTTIFHDYVYSWISCFGLICLVSLRHVYVCNPSTHEFLKLPEASFWFEDIGLGFIPARNEYKVVNVFLRNEFWCEMFTITDGGGSNSDSWRMRKTPCRSMENGTASVCVNGFIYWLATDFDLCEKVLSLDLEKEEFGLIRHPQYYLDLDYSDFNCFRLSLVELKGLLCLVDDFFSPVMDVWMLKDHRSHTWVKKYIINFSIVDGNIDICRRPLAEVRGEILIESNQGDRFYYNCEESNQGDLYYYNCENGIFRRAEESNAGGTKRRIHFASFFALGSRVFVCDVPFHGVKRHSIYATSPPKLVVSCEKLFYSCFITSLLFPLRNGERVPRHHPSKLSLEMEDVEDGLHKPPKRVVPNINSKDEVTKGTALPGEILIDILTRLPVKDLCRFRSVSKEWLALISSDQLFLNMHTRLSYRTPLYTTCNGTIESENDGRAGISVVKITTVDLNNGSLCDQFTTIFRDHICSWISCFGLICFIAFSQVYVCNPSNHELLELPKAICAVQDIGFGFIPVRNEYIVAHLFPDFRPEHQDDRNLLCEMFTITDGGGVILILGGLEKPLVYTWRRAPRRPQYYLDLDYSDFTEYWLSLVELKGVLCLVDNFCISIMDVWTLKDHSNYTWVKEYSINFSTVDGYIDNMGFRPLAEVRGEILIESNQGDMFYYSFSKSNRGDLYYYNCENGIFRRAEESNADGTKRRVYFASLFALGSR
ncbi:uncharacterized protein LOC132278028 [Cornus florida]|uniref:uncharacterized protein LOC132278028 n=1 Tax=Cornus florida TaxID=4283 RepID=UPI00289AE506|nr:uncharacterized protein LOC132278028 [Cornus florida]